MLNLREFVDAEVAKALSAVRPGYSKWNVDPTTTLGWLLRFGLGPFMRGFCWRLFRVRNSGGLFFVGRNVRVYYAKKLRVGRSVSLGDGVTINAFSIDGVTFGNNVTLRERCWIQCSSSPNRPGEALVLGDSVYVGPDAIIGVGAKIFIGAGAQLGAGVVLIAENHVGVMEDGTAPEVMRGGIEIGANCWLGHRVSVTDGVVLGENCVVGVGSVVTRSFPANSVIAGVPARLIR